jgi:hypothetical protein
VRRRHDSGNNAGVMLLLTASFDARRARRDRAPWMRAALVGLATLGLVLLGLALEAFDIPARGVGVGLASGGVHVGFLALGWVVAAGPAPARPGPAVAVGSALLLASVASRLTPWGALLYLVVPALMLRAATREPFVRAVGLGVRAGFKPTAMGIAAGAFLGVHLLVSIPMTFGYSIRVDHVSQYLGAVAYDIGANALTAEWLFRGALFSRWWQRWDFWSAAGLSTALAVGRYLVDPALPAALEIRAGAIFYMSLLGLTACALRAGSGSLLPGYGAAVTFFMAYRLLAP